MRIAVLIKQVPGSESPLNIDSSNKALDESQVAYIINESDNYAIEEALQICDNNENGEVVIISMGPQRVQKVIREALAKGAHRAIHIVTDSNESTDPLTTASVLADAIKNEKFDIVFSGLQSDDLGFGQTGVILGEMLEMSTATLAMSTELSDGKIKVKRELESGYFQWITMTLPASISVQSGCNTPRYPSLKGIMGAKKKEISEVKFDGANSSQEIKRLYAPRNSKETVMIEGSTDEIVKKLVDVLKNEIKIAKGLFMDILVVLEDSNGKIHRLSVEAIVGAQKFASAHNLSVSALVIGMNAEALSSEAAQYNIDKVLKVTNDLVSTYSSDGYTEVIRQIIERESPKYILFGHSYQVRDYVPKLSAKLRKPFLADSVAFDISEDSAVSTKQMYNAKLLSDIAPNEEPPYLISFQSATFNSDNINSGTAQIEDCDISFDSSIIKTQSEEPFKELGEDLDLSTANLIVSVGRGIGKEENIPLAKDLAETIGADLSSSRPVVDSGWLPSVHQVGSSGQSVAPKMYLALGISGAIQHVVGMKGSKNIVAINKDPDAPIFELADYGVVGDLLEILPKLTEALR